MRTLEVRYVEWRDSAGNNGWHPLNDSRALEPDSCVSVGFVIAETDDAVTLLQSFTNRNDETLDQGDNAIAIPKFAISKSRSLTWRTSR